MESTRQYGVEGGMQWSVTGTEEAVGMGKHTRCGECDYSVLVLFMPSVFLVLGSAGDSGKGRGHASHVDQPREKTESVMDEVGS